MSTPIDYQPLTRPNCPFSDTSPKSRLFPAYGGREFSTRSLRRMMQFAQSMPDLQIVSTMSTQLSWSHVQETPPLQSIRMGCTAKHSAANKCFFVKILLHFQLFAVTL